MRPYHKLQTDAYYARNRRCHQLLDPSGQPIRVALDLVELVEHALALGIDALDLCDGDGTPTAHLKLERLADHHQAA